MPQTPLKAETLMRWPFQFWVLDLRGRLVTMFHDELPAETYIRRKAEQLEYMLLKNTYSGHTYKYDPSTAGFELISKYTKL